jgi:hypothetical protein
LRNDDFFMALAENRYAEYTQDGGKRRSHADAACVDAAHADEDGRGEAEWPDE